MHVETVLTIEDLERLLRDLTPLRIHMSGPDGPQRWLELDPPEKVSLEAGVGVRVVTSGRFRYTKGKLPIAAEIREVRLRLEPRVVDDGPEGLRLAFALEIEHGDLVMVPGIIDDGIVALVNDALTPRSTKLVWRFSDALGTELALSPRMQPVDRVTTEVSAGEVKVGEAEVRFKIRLKATLHRGGERTDAAAA